VAGTTKGGGERKLGASRESTISASTFSAS
jgi:hypothetical protein